MGKHRCFEGMSSASTFTIKPPNGNETPQTAEREKTSSSTALTILLSVDASSEYATRGKTGRQEKILLRIEMLAPLARFSRNRVLPLALACR